MAPEPVRTEKTLDAFAPTFSSVHLTADTIPKESPPPLCLESYINKFPLVTVADYSHQCRSRSPPYLVMKSGIITGKQGYTVDHR